MVVSHFHTAPILQSGITKKLAYGNQPDYFVNTTVSIYGGDSISLIGKAVQHWAYFRVKESGKYFISDVGLGSLVFMWNGNPALESFVFGGNQAYFGAPYGSRPTYGFGTFQAGQIVPIRIISSKSSSFPEKLDRGGLSFKISGPGESDGNPGPTLINGTVSGADHFFRKCEGVQEFKYLGSTPTSTASFCAPTTVTVTSAGKCPTVTCSAVTMLN